VGEQQSVGVKCRDCPYQDIWHAVRTDRDVCKHDLVHDDHRVEYVDADDVTKSVTMDGEVVARHDEQQRLVTDGGERVGDYRDPVTCPECGGNGRIIGCYDDLCHAQGECMHGDSRPCRECRGTGVVPRGR